MSTLKRTFVSLLSVAIMAASLPVQARAGASSGGARSAPAASRSAPAPSRAAPAPATPQRVTSGGMQRSDVMSQARAQSPNTPRVAPAPAPAAAPAPVTSNYGTTQQQQQQRQGYSGGQMAGAAAAAGVGGYLLGRATAPTPAPAAAPHAGYAPGTSGGYVQGSPNGYAQNGDYGPATHPYQGAPAPMGMAPSSSSGGMGFFGMLLILALLGGFAYFMYRRFSEQNAGAARSFGSSAARSSNAFSQGSSTPVAETELLNRAPKMFRDVQNANNAGDKAALERLVDESFLPQLVADIDNRAEPSRTSVMNLDVVGDRVLGFTREGYRYVGSVQFNALISEGGAPAETVEEVWHFVRNVDGGEWKLAGIEQV